MVYTERVPLPPSNLTLVSLLMDWVVPEVDNNLS